MCGVIDIGSNTIRLVIYKVKDKSLVPMLNKKFSVGLASYINGDRSLKPRGVEKRPGDGRGRRQHRSGVFPEQPAVFFRVLSLRLAEFVQPVCGKHYSDRERA